MPSCFDLGIVGHKISYVSSIGTLGVALELKKLVKDPTDYNYILLSRNINDFHRAAGIWPKRHNHGDLGALGET